MDNKIMLALIESNEYKKKILFIVIVSFAIIGIFFPFLDYAYGESDFTFEAKVREFTYIISDYALDVTRFEIQGESDKQICLSGQCRIEVEGAGNFDAPTPDYMSMYNRVEFKVIDDHPNNNIGPKMKEFLEKFSTNTFCDIDGIIEDNGQEVYTCIKGSTSIDRKFDSKSWHYDTIVTYDAKNNSLRVVGNYTGSR